MPCLAGEFSRTGLTPCYPCPRDYYQPDPGKSYCLSCPFYGTTTIIGARSITDCSSMSNYLCWRKWVKGTSKGWQAVILTENISLALLTSVDLPFHPVNQLVLPTGVASVLCMSDSITEYTHTECVYTHTHVVYVYYIYIHTVERDM